MSEEQLNDETPDCLVRTFAAELTPGDGRTADVRIIKYGETALANDGLQSGTRPGVVYRETWEPGAFNHQLNAANRVVANVEHEEGVAGMIGHGVALREAADGFYGSFKFLNTPAADTALELVREGVFGGISLEARPVRSVRRADGVVARMKANLMAIAFCRSPAYAGSQVLALREEEDLVEPVFENEAFVANRPNAELLKRVRELGIELPPGLDTEVELLIRAFSDDAWDGSASNYSSTEAYCEACIIDDNPSGKPKVEALCHLPVKEPDGDYNLNGIRNALARLDQVKTSSAKKAAARTRLEALLARGNKATPNKDADDKN